MRAYEREGGRAEASEQGRVASWVSRGLGIGGLGDRGLGSKRGLESIQKVNAGATGVPLCDSEFKIREKG